jgi:hypothetical protein
MKTSEGPNDPNKTRPLHLRTGSAVYVCDEERLWQKPFWQQFNFYLVLFTAVYSIVSLALWCVTKNALKQEVLVNRPVILNNAITIVDRDEGGSPKTVKLAINNFGKTVAINTTPIGHLEISDFDRAAPRETPDAIHLVSRQRTCIIPRSRHMNWGDLWSKIGYSQKTKAALN